MFLDIFILVYIDYKLFSAIYPRFPPMLVHPVHTVRIYGRVERVARRDPVKE